MLVSTGRYGTLSFWTSFFLQVSNWQVPTGTVWYLGRYLLTRSLYLVGRQVGGRYLPVPGQVRYGTLPIWQVTFSCRQLLQVGRLPPFLQEDGGTVGGRQVGTGRCGTVGRQGQVGRYRQRQVARFNLLKRKVCYSQVPVPTGTYTQVGTVPQVPYGT